MISRSIDQTQKIAKNFLEKDLNTNLVFLNGNLGSGKTQFVKGIGKALKIKENITSPTFVLIKEYKINKHSKFKKLIHADLYRLKKLDEFTKNQIVEYADDKSNLVFVEWPEKIKKILSNHQIIKFEHIDENSRKITIS